jgi:tyrosine-protein kinase Etk/Wzc
VTEVTAASRVAGLPVREYHLRDLLTTLRRHWRIVILIPTLVAAGAWLAGRNAIPQYQSRLTVQITSPKQVFARLDDIDVDEFALKTDPILSEALVLTTQGLALKVVRALGLQVEVAEPALRRGDLFTRTVADSEAVVGAYALHLRGSAGYELRDASGAVLAAGPYHQPASGPGFELGVRPTTDEREVGLTVSAPEWGASWVSAGLAYAVREGTNAVDMYFTGTDPTLVPRILNEAAVQLRLDGAQRAQTIAARKREYIFEQLGQSRLTYQAKLADLQEFKEQRAIADLSAEAQGTVSAIQDLELERQRLLVELASVDEAMSDSGAIGVESLNRLAAVQHVSDNAALEFQLHHLLELYEQRRSLMAGTLGFRGDNPQVLAIDQRITETHEALRDAVRGARRTLQVHLQALDTKIAELRNHLATYPGMETRISQIQLEAGIQEQTTRYLMGQYESARLQEATIAPYITILDGASPAYRIGTSVRQKVVLGLMVGLLLGIGGAFFLEYLDQTIKTVQDVDRVLGTPVLGMVPLDAKLGGRAGNGRRPISVITALEGDDPAAEAYRTLRTNVTFVGAERPVQLMAVTSAGPGEGKSTTAANLAVTLALGGHKTLLIDADMRRPLLHRAFGLVQDPGLTDVLIGLASAREAIRPDVLERLDVLPAGSSPPNPSELLGSDAMHGLVGEVRRTYDYIVVDTPPVLPVTDATVVSTIADATILTVRSGETEEASALRALDQLKRVGARIAGVVLNGVDTRRDRHYMYYKYQKNVAYKARGPVRTIGRRISRMF